VTAKHSLKLSNSNVNINLTRINVAPASEQLHVTLREFKFLEIDKKNENSNLKNCCGRMETETKQESFLQGSRTSQVNRELESGFHVDALAVSQPRLIVSRLIT
jgi:hypothetical protein